MTLETSALVSTFSISQWTARKFDKEITNEVHTTHSANNDAGRYNKLLVSKVHTDPIAKIATKARAFHYKNTLPWSDNGERLLPVENYMPYLMEMNKFKDEFDDAAKHFMANYDSVITEAKIRLNGMYNPKDYPSRSEVSDKFGFKTTFMPVPTNDFRVGLTDAQVDTLKAAVEKEINDRLVDAVKDIWKRIKEQVTHMRDKLSTTDAIFRDSLFDNLKDLVYTLPKLNVTHDKTIIEVCNDMKDLLVDPNIARSNNSVRSEKAEKAQVILNKFADYFQP